MMSRSAFVVVTSWKIVRRPGLLPSSQTPRAVLSARVTASARALSAAPAWARASPPRASPRSEMSPLRRLAHVAARGVARSPALGACQSLAPGFVPIPRATSVVDPAVRLRAARAFAARELAPFRPVPGPRAPRGLATKAAAPPAAARKPPQRKPSPSASNAPASAVTRAPPRADASSATRVQGAASSSGDAAAEKLKAWSLYYTHENAYLNWMRNGATFTAVGMAFASFRLARDQAEFSMGGVLLQGMGSIYVLLGSAQYLGAAIALRRALCVTPLGCAWYVLNAAWPPTLYLIAMACIHEMHPSWFLLLVSANIERLPRHWQARCMDLIRETRLREFEERRGSPVAPAGRFS